MPTIYQLAFEALTVEQRNDDAVRWSHVGNKSFAIPTDADIAFIGARAVNARQGFIEVGAGWGYWSSELIAAGHTVSRVSDLSPPSPGQRWRYATVDGSRDDSANAYWVDEVVEEAAAVTWVGQRQRTILAVCPVFEFTGIADYSGDRVIVVQEDHISWSTKNDVHAGALLADGWQIVESYNMALAWPGYETRLEVWERA